jgi:long-chain acyl-CoA synthetase
MSLATARRARENPTQYALTDERLTLTWSELDPILNRVTNAILGANLTKVGRVAVFAANAVENVMAYIGALQAGVASVPINFHQTADEVAYILKDSDTELLFVGPETANIGLQAAAKSGVKTVIGWRGEESPGLTSWAEWLAAASAAEPPSDMEPKAHLQYTSGTTGIPKGVETPPTQIPQTATVANLFEGLVARWEAQRSPSPVLVVSPMYHTGPLNWVRYLGGGASVIVMSRFDPEKVLETIDRYGVQGLMLVPTHFRRLLALPTEVRERYKIDSIKLVTHTGAACPKEVKRAMIEWWGMVFLEAYGGTESSSTTLITSEEWLKKPGSVGRAISPYELLIVNEYGKRLGPREEGRIYFRDTTGRGIIYYKDPVKTAAAHIEPGVFTLGEIGYYDEDGYLYITDRFSDMIVSGGVNIYPVEVENVLILHPDILDVAVVGVPNVDMGEEVRALVIPRNAANPPKIEDLKTFCRQTLAGFKCPASYEFVDDVGRNALGKINKRELRRRYWTGEQKVG